MGTCRVLVLCSWLAVFCGFGRASTLGTEFITSFLQNDSPSSSQQKYELRFTAHQDNTTVIIAVLGTTFTQNLTISAGRTISVQLPASVEIRGNMRFSNTVYIRSSKPINIISLNQRFRSAETSIVYPLTTLGTRYYLVTPKEGPPNSYKVFSIIASKENTSVEIHSKGRLEFNDRLYPANSVLTMNLVAFESIHLRSSDDLSGSEVRSRKQVAVLSGHSCASRNQYCSHVCEQLLPVERWGRNYSIAPLSLQGNEQIVTVIASGNTKLNYVLGDSKMSLDMVDGQAVDIALSSLTLSITASISVQVTFFSCGGRTMRFENPPLLMNILDTGSYCSSYYVYGQRDISNYVVIVARNVSIAGITFDGRRLQSHGWRQIPETDYVWLQHFYGNSFTSHRVQHPNDSFGLQSIGVGAQFSYGSPGSCVKGPDAPPPSCSSTVCPWRHECVMDNGKPKCIPLKFNACWASGDPHYTTFDKWRYDFMGTCTYVFASVSEDAPKHLQRFTVLTKNENRGNVRVSYVGVVTFQSGDYAIDIKKGEVGFIRINNIKSCLPVTLNNGSEDMMRLFQSANTFVLHYAKDVMLSYDWNHVVRLELTSRYSSNVSGLCGNFNRNPKDDFQTPSKSQAPNAIEFGRSWKVGSDPTCWDDCSGPCLSCPPNVAAKFKSDEYCGLIEKTDDGPFSQCHSLVDPSAYMEDCVYDVCLNNGYKKFSCQAVKDYANTCQRAGANITDWRKATGCPFKCQENSTYRLCGRSCPLTCQDRNASSPCTDPCVEQCECNPGFLLIGGKCLSDENCGCVYEGRSYTPNEAFWGDNTCRQWCVCNGRSQRVECSETSCRAGEECGVKDGLQGCYPTSFGRCSTCGGTHYFPYDGGRNELTGNCQYQFSALCDHSQGLTDFQVYIHSWRLGNLNISYVAKVGLQVYGSLVEMSRQHPDQVLVNGELHSLPFSSRDRRVHVYMEPASMVVRTTFALTLVYDKSWNVMLSLPGSYAGAVGGLCGNFDKNSNNDGTSSVSPAASCNKWKPNESCGAVTRPDCVGLTDKERAQRAKATECGVLLDHQGPFRDCHALVNPENDFTTCVYVSCILKKRLNSLCSVFMAYTGKCQAAGGNVHPWRSKSFCPFSCQPNSHYEVCATGCPTTCDGLTSPAGCESGCREGCACDKDHVLSGGACVPFSQCGCIYQDTYYRVGETLYVGESCSMRCTCSNGGDMSCSPNSCSANEKCSVQNGRRGCHPIGFATCTASGDPHFRKFSGHAFNFQGLGDFILSQNIRSETETNLTDFRVITKQEKFGPSASVVRQVTLEVHGHNLTMVRNGNGIIKVNGTDYRLPVTLQSGKIRCECCGQKTCVELDFGLKVTFDHMYRVTVSVPSTYMGWTSGLCGNYKGNANDEVGRTANEIMAFGNKWRVCDPVESCSVGCGASDNPCPMCEGAKSDVFSSKDYCGVMSSAVFTKCHPVVSFTQYVEDCVFDLCQANGESGILCNNVASYAEACKAAGVTDIQWRREDFCSLPCPVHSHYSVSADLCSISCASLTDTHGCSGEFHEACQCDDGYFFDGTECKEVQECGCFGNGRYYKLNETVLSEDCTSECHCDPDSGLSCRDTSCAGDERCQIQDGVRACINIDPCKSKQCRSKEICKLQGNKAVCMPLFNATCRALGDPHYCSFDGWMYDFQGTCSYIMAKSFGDSDGLPAFQVIAKNGIRGNQAVSFVRSTTIEMYDTVITLQAGQVGRMWVNGKLVTVPAKLANDKISVTHSGWRVVVESDTGFLLAYDRTWQLVITIPSSYFNMTSGLCGNLNQNPKDDQMSRNGTKMTSITDWAASWSVYDQDPFCWHSYPGKSPTCDDTKKNRYSGDESCGILLKEDGPFRECSSIISLNKFFDSCLYDVCLYDGAQIILCQALETYASTCMQHEVKIHDWRSPAKCPKVCGENSHYEACGNACPASCSDRNAPARCTKSCVEICQCNDNFVMSVDKCVPVSSCGCQYEGRYYQPNQVFWSDANCKTRCRCDPTMEMVVCRPTSCKSGESCMVDNGVLGCYPTKYSTCTISGNARSVTFDGNTFALKGSCVYQLIGVTSNESSLTQFTVSVQQVTRGNKVVSYARDIIIGVYGQTFTFSKAFPRQVQVDGILREMPYTQDAGLPTTCAARHSGWVSTFSFASGVTISFDGDSNTAHVTVPSTYTGAVNGLCGNNNQDPEDDFSAGGEAAATEEEFVKYWAVGNDSRCMTASPSPPPCTAAQSELYRTESHCGIISSPNGPFSPCHATIDSKSYFDKCLSGACQYSGFWPIVCSIIASYVSACHSKGIKMKEWRTPLKCLITCPKNSHYELCGDGCPNSCDGLALPSSCVPSCTEGCYCDNGFILSGRDCVPIAQCGCSHRSTYYKVGEVFYRGAECQERCTCGQDKAVSCQNHMCRPHEECSVAHGRLGCHPTDTVQCSIWGSQHGQTFDGRKFDFRGACTYTLLKLNSDKYKFWVTINNDPHGKGLVSGTKSVNVQVNDLNVRMESGATGRVMINNEGHNLPYVSQNDQVWINQEGNNVILNLQFQLTVSFYMGSALRIRVPSSLAGSTHGLCGNYNSDLIDGDNLPDGTAASDPAVFGAFFAVAKDGMDCAGCTEGTCSRCNPTEEKKAKSNSKCGLIGDPQGPFKDCHTMVPPDSYVTSCVQDTCAGGGQALCMNLQAYGAKCQAAGANVTGTWRNTVRCPLTCPANSHYEPCTRTCDYTCSGVLTESSCSDRYYEGCECDTGHVLDGDRCVSLGQCGCVYHGRYLKAEESLVTEDCRQICACQAGSVSCMPTRCKEDERCQLRDGRRDCYPRESDCTISLKQHFITFDGAPGTFPSEGAFILASSCSMSTDEQFMIVLDIRKCRDGSPSKRALHISTYSALITVTGAREIWYNGWELHDPDSVSAGPVRVQVSALNVTTIEVIDRMTAVFHADGEVKLTAKEKISKETCGACGNFNGDQSDDLRLRNGDPASSVTYAAYSWRARYFSTWY